MKSQGVARLKLITSMFVFGTIGIFVRYIPLSSGIIAFVRGVIGVLFLLLLTRVLKIKLSGEAIKQNFVLLLISGGAIGVNWILLFEAYRYTSVATATLCYYLAPVFVIILSPLVIKQKTTLKKWACVLVALLGMVFVSGVFGEGFKGINQSKGILFGIGAALFYASVILINQKIKNIGAYEKTIVQLFFAALFVLPYVLLTEDVATLEINIQTVILLLTVGIVHTGIAYALYFGSMSKIKAQTVAIFGYIDPALAIILSAVILKESMGVFEIIGAVLILGAAFVSEMPEKGKMNAE